MRLSGVECEIDLYISYLAREYGVARYERLRAADFAAADLYYQRTRHFWDDVHAGWDATYAHHPRLDYRIANGQTDPGDRLTQYADQPAKGESPALPAAQVIRESLQAVGTPARTASNRQSASFNVVAK